MGNALVQELGLEPGVDTLSRWMAHYVSEQIALAENTSDNEKTEARQRCFDTILKLWDHRLSLPNNRYPFESFERIFETLSRLDPENSSTYYFENSHFENTENEDIPEDQTNEVQLWINVALSIDAAARVLIDTALKQAANHAEDEKIVAWLEKSGGISNDNNYDISIMTRLLEEPQEDDIAEKVCERTRQKLSLRIKKLDLFIELSQLLREDLRENLEGTLNKDSSTDL
ncbi:MAG: hypothetical protein V7L30_31765 [Nostoc sp.]|uniref:hypothetical protein n=1 Tax=Nostoc sp. TaxID=1180 RepID=UPI002FFCFEF9